MAKGNGFSSTDREANIEGRVDAPRYQRKERQVYTKHWTDINVFKYTGNEEEREFSREISETKRAAVLMQWRDLHTLKHEYAFFPMDVVNDHKVDYGDRRVIHALTVGWYKHVDGDMVHINDPGSIHKLSNMLVDRKPIPDGYGVHNFAIDYTGIEDSKAKGATVHKLKL